MSEFGRSQSLLMAFLTQFNDACFTRKDGLTLSKMLSLQEMGDSKHRHTLMYEFNESLISRYVFAPWDDVLIAHLKSCIAYIETEDVIEAFNHKCTLIQAFNKVLSQLKDENWALPVMFVSAIELRKLAKAADYTRRGNYNSSDVKVHVRPDEFLEEAAAQIMSCFRICTTDNRANVEVSKKKGMINLINQLFKIYFKINKLHLCKPLIRALESAQMMEHFSLAQIVTYNYFTGMKLLFDSEYKSAEIKLSYSFNNCHSQSYKNQRLILIFLIPVKMILGHMPSARLLSKYDLEYFGPIVKAVKEGNLKALDQSLEANADFFWNYGIYLILEKLKIIAYRNIFKKVSLIVKTHQIPIETFVCALKYLENENITIEEVHCILANLIFEGKIKGYISLQHQKLVISKQNPFPALSSVA